jgi:hypothetical protein
MLRACVRFCLPTAAALMLLATVPPVAAQPAQQCADTPAKQARKSMFGSILGGIADSALGRAGLSTGIAGVYLPVGSLLSDAIINLLDCHERQQAAKATDEAVRGGVGTEVAWKSDTRPNVTGKSTVTAQEQLADGGQCMTVTDVVIVDGQETTVPKRMCRAAGASGYTRA